MSTYLREDPRSTFELPSKLGDNTCCCSKELAGICIVNAAAARTCVGTTTANNFMATMVVALQGQASSTFSHSYYTHDGRSSDCSLHVLLRVQLYLSRSNGVSD